MSEHEKPAPRARRLDLYDAFGLFTRGVAMGVADVIPGVSGGTIAFISGIYERFIAALKSLSPVFLFSLIRGDIRGAWRQALAMHWETLIPLGIGIGLSIVTMSKLIIGLMEDQRGPTYAFFFGLILASSWMPLAHMKGFSWRHVAAILVFAGAAWAFVGLRAGPIELRVARADAGATSILYPAKLRSETDIAAVEREAQRVAASQAAVGTVALFDPNGLLGDRTQIGAFNLVRLESAEAGAEYLRATPELIVLEEQRAPLYWILICGSLAISAMILPGVSGSFLLLFLGQYQAVFSTIHQCIGHISRLLGRTPDPLVAIAGREWYSDFVFVGVFGIGLLIGLAVFSRIVDWLFARAHDVTMAALAGIMLGALRQPGAVVLEAAAESGDRAGAYWTIVVVVALAGAAIVLGLHFADAWLRSRRAAVVAER